MKNLNCFELYTSKQLKDQSNQNSINKEVLCLNKFDNIFSFFRNNRSSLATTSQIAILIKSSSPYQLALVVRSEATTPRNLHNPSSKLHLQWGRGRLLLLLDSVHPIWKSTWARKICQKNWHMPKTICNWGHWRLLLSPLQIYLERKNTKVSNYFFLKNFVFLGSSDWEIWS